MNGLRVALERVESGFDRVYGPDWNPCYQLGALGWFCYWIVAASGIYLYVFFDTGVTEAYASVEQITNAQWFAGGVMRSLHRYASDLLVIVVVLHLLREWVLGRMRGPRWFTWVVGVPLAWFVFAAGLSGYWVVWDRLAQYVAIATTEWLDALPFFAEPIARNFLDPSTLSGRFFTLLVFIHIAVPLALLFGMWVHIQRLSRPRVNPPLGLAAGTLAALLVLALVHPATSQGPADLATVPARVGLDWFYLFPLPLEDRYTGGAVWLAAAAVTVGLLVVPWMRRRRRAPAAARVDLGNCNGCGRCAADCPYSAITLAPRSDGAPYSHEATVRADLCAACGICVGACPTATPFRRRGELIPGIDLPDLPAHRLRALVLDATAALDPARPRLLVVGCGHGPDLDALAGPDVAVLALPCAGMLPPSFVDFALARGHAAAIVVTGCREGDCFHRLGAQWTDARIEGVRDPKLRRRVPLMRVVRCWAGVDRTDELRDALDALRARLVAGTAEPRPDPAATAPAPATAESG